MNKATIESIEWHKDRLFKLLEDDELIKIEGNIHSVKTDLDEIIEKAKTKKKVWVKPTATKKGHYREQEVGSSEEMGWRMRNKATHAAWLRHQKREARKPERGPDYKDPTETHLDELRVEEIKKLGLKQGDKVQLKSQFGSKVVAFSDKVDPLTIEKKVEGEKEKA